MKAVRGLVIVTTSSRARETRYFTTPPTFLSFRQKVVTIGGKRRISARYHLVTTYRFKVGTWVVTTGVVTPPRNKIADQGGNKPGW